MATKTAIIVPAYNEAPCLGGVLAALCGLGHMVVVVDDGSVDGTASVASGFPVHLLRHSCNLGQGAAIQTGLSYALEKGADILVTFDADGQHCVEDIHAITQPIAERHVDVVFGSRFLGSARNMGAWRRGVVKVATRIFTMVSGVHLSDANCGIRAFSRYAASKIHITQNRMAHTLELIEQVKAHKLVYEEIPVTITYTEYSMSKGQSLGGFFRIFVDWVFRL